MVIFISFYIKENVYQPVYFKFIIRDEYRLFQIQLFLTNLNQYKSILSERPLVPYWTKFPFEKVQLSTLLRIFIIVYQCNPKNNRRLLRQNANKL